MLDNGINVILDRYVYSNMAHQGGKLKDQNERFKMFEWLETLEFGLLELPHADIKLFLHVPYEVSNELKKSRTELPDQHEMSEEHLKNSEKAYLEIVGKYNFKKFECNDGNKIRPIEDINNEIYNYIIDLLK